MLKPHGELTLDHLKVLDVGGGTVKERNLAGLLVGNRKRVLEATEILPDFVTPALFRLDALTTDLFLASQRTGFVWRGSDWLEIIIVVGIRRLGIPLGAVPGHTRWGVSDGIVPDITREGGRE